MYGERVLRFIARQTLDVQVAYDLHAEVFAVAFARRHQFRGSSAEEEQAWLFMVARRELSAFWRRGRVKRAAMARLKLERPALDDAAIERLEELAELDSVRPQLAAALGSLAPAQREAVELRVLNELGYEEIAARMNVSHDVARARVSRGLRTLHDVMSSGDYAVRGQA
jgi:RNA polymerase sigma factor (sigma-70 family)